MINPADGIAAAATAVLQAVASPAAGEVAQAVWAILVILAAFLLLVALVSLHKITVLAPHLPQDPTRTPATAEMVAKAKSRVKWAAIRLAGITIVGVVGVAVLAWVG